MFHIYYLYLQRLQARSNSKGVEGDLAPTYLATHHFSHIYIKKNWVYWKCSLSPLKYVQKYKEIYKINQK